MPVNVPKIAIAAFSDMDPRPERRRLWGEYWIKKRLEDEFIRRGCRVEESADKSRPDVLIHLFGQPLREMPEAGCRILWIHSHPNDLPVPVPREYDIVLCSSRPFTEKLNKGGTKARWLMIPTHMKPMPEVSPYMEKTDVIFVGNNRRQGMRRLMADLMSIGAAIDCSLKVWGDGWDGTIPAGWYAGREYPAESLNELYSSAKIILNDHHEDMAREGFINPRILDGLAAGTMVITDPVLGIGELFHIPVYHDADELLAMINKYLTDEIGRENIVKNTSEKLNCFTYENSVRIILEMCGI